MPLRGGYTTYRPEKPPDEVGVYEIAYGGNLVYIGSGNIQGRLEDHYNGSQISFRKYRCKITNNRRRAEQIERGELKQFKEENGRLPRYNDRIP